MTDSRAEATPTATLRAVIKRADGRVEDLGIVASTGSIKRNRWRAAWRRLVRR